MTQYEILRMAAKGISARIGRENEINEITVKNADAITAYASTSLKNYAPNLAKCIT